jgi:hypothetical protein
MRIFSVVTHTTSNNAKNASLQLGGTFMATLSQVCQSIFSLVSRLIASCITVLVTATHLPQSATGEKPRTIKMIMAT